MKVTCNDRERIFLVGTAEEWAELEAHAAGCAECKQEVEGWKNLSVVAGELHEEWDSPALWPRIEKALAERARPSGPSWWGHLLGGLTLAFAQWQTVAAALLLVALTSSAVWFIVRRPIDSGVAHDILLKQRAVDEVEKTEAAYEQAIDKLDVEARPQLEGASTPLMASYREKLQVLDSAITELKSQAGINPANGHLRRQLLAMYREKQDTLEQVLEAKQ